MVKTLRKKAGILFDAALVVAGWMSFIAGQIIPDPLLKSILLSIARVLPYEPSWCSSEI